MLQFLQTERLLLRAPRAADIGAFVPLLNDYQVSKNLSRVPHPYTEDDGCAFVVRSADGRAAGSDYTFMVLRRTDGVLVGMCGVHPAREFEIGYWIGRPYWGNGYATEAARCVVLFAFRELGAVRVIAGWFQDNPASGRVLEKLGFLPTCTEERVSLSRGQAVYCQMMAIERTAFESESKRRPS
jgi:RimJ/RimL family protein N-acetyltransferase